MDHDQTSGLISPVDKLENDLNIGDAVKGIQDALQATRSVWNGKERVEEPDHRARLSAIEMILQYRIGKPVERREVIVNKSNNLDEMIRMAKRSPAIRKSVKRLAEMLDGEEAEKTL